MTFPDGAIVALVFAPLLALFSWLNWRRAATLVDDKQRGQRQRCRSIAIGYGVLAALALVLAVLLVLFWGLGD